jgi:CRP/FNR family transcriptional regulator
MPNQTEAPSALPARLTAAFPALRALPAPVLARLARSAQLRRLPRGTVLFERGDPCAALPFLLSGQVRVTRATGDGKSIQLYTVLPGEVCVVSNGALLGALPFDATGTAATEVEIAAVPAEVVDELIAQEPAFRGFVFRMFGERIADLMGLVEAVAFQKLDRRLARLLVERGPRVVATHQALADDLGVAREMVSRVLRSFADRGLIEQQREALSVIDPAALERHAG